MFGPLFQQALSKEAVFLSIRDWRTESSHSELFSFSVNREKKVFPVLPKSDIAKLLDTIDRNSTKGKRDYAIMLLGTVLGLRACDAVALKLTDIDWLRGEIRIVQSKTSNPVILPLTQDVGEALKDYILNARPSTTDKEIFLRINAPHKRLAAAVTVGEIYRNCCIAAGLPASTRFHNLRRALGTSMVTKKHIPGSPEISRFFRVCVANVLQFNP